MDPYQTYKKNRSMGPELIWPDITIDMSVVFEDILALTRVRHLVISKRIIVQTQIYYIVI